MSNSTDALVGDLNTTIFWIGHIISVIQISFGTLGNLFNTIIFTRRSLRSNPCSSYLFAASISNLFEIYVVILFRYLSISWNWIPANTNMAWCIINGFLSYPLIALGSWFIVLCSFDRFLTSSRNANIRKISSLPLARKMVFCTTLFFFILYGHIAIIIRPFRIDHETSCTALSSAYIVFYNMLFVIVGNVLPIILMAILGILTAFNVGRIGRSVAPQVGNTRNKRLRSKDQQLIRMLLCQVLITVLISIPFCCVSMYNTFARVLLQHQLSPPETAIIDFTANFLAMLYLTNSVTGFYIYTLTGHKFRAEFKRCVGYGLKLLKMRT